MLPSHGAQNLSIPNHYFAFLRQVMEKIYSYTKKVLKIILLFKSRLKFGANTYNDQAMA